MEALCLGFLFVLLLPAASISGQETIDYLHCLRNSTTQLSTGFTPRLGSVLREFTDLSTAGTKNATRTDLGSGASDPPLYAFFQCRGDLSTRLCSACVQKATEILPQACPEAVGARVKLDGCFLRYDNRSFFQLDTSGISGSCSSGIGSDQLSFIVVNYLWNNVTTDAPRRGGFAMATFSGTYGMAECWAYLNQSDCSRCLSETLNICEGATRGTELYLASCWYRVDAPPVPSSGLKKKATIIAVTTVLGGILVVGAFFVWRWRGRRFQRLGSTNKWHEDLFQSKTQLFSFNELEEATEQFNHANILGEGGFGIVYKGTLSNGKQVAIKKLRLERGGQTEFLNEVNLITSVQHKNIIRLLGCCVEAHERMLVYEYLQNKSLDFFLFEEHNARTLDWTTRLNVVIGMARGLAYLHEDSYIPIIHRDIKAHNILLDDELSPVIADFGIARPVDKDATHVNTNAAGTLGYMAPEYAFYGILTKKVDVFSFGLVTLEIVAGQKNSHGKLLRWVWESHENGNILEVVDERLDGVFSAEEVRRLVLIALLCTQEEAERRPTMSAVVQWLSGTYDILENPMRPSFLKYNATEPTAADLNRFSFLTPSSFQSGLRSGGVASSNEISAAR